MGLVIVSLAGLPCKAIELSPSSIAFGNVAIGNSSTRTETAKNSTARNVVLTEAAVSGTGFRLLYHPAFPYRLGSGANAVFKIKFAPEGAGYASGHLTVHYKYLHNVQLDRDISTSAMSGARVTLSGSFAPNPTSLNFDTVQPSFENSLYETITNSRSSSVTVSQIITTGAGYGFSGIILPITLSGKQSATFTVRFRPQTGGSYNGKLTIKLECVKSDTVGPTIRNGAVSGQLAVTLASDNFGSVALGSQKTQMGILSAGNGPCASRLPTSVGRNSQSAGFLSPSRSIPVKVLRIS